MTDFCYGTPRVCSRGQESSGSSTVEHQIFMSYDHSVGNTTDVLSALLPAIYSSRPYICESTRPERGPEMVLSPLITIGTLASDVM
jgi:hypothetical protein